MSEEAAEIASRPPTAYIGTPGEGAPPAAPTTASQVLEHHTQLHDLLARPNPATRSIVRQFGELADGHPGERLRSHMLWPFRVGDRPPRPDWEAHFLVRLARGLLTALTYQVTAPMCEIAEAIYEHTAEEADHISASDLPAESGFLWLDKPFRRADPEGGLMQFRAMTWSPQSVRYGDGDPLPGVRVTLWSDWGSDPAAVRTFTNRAPSWQRMLALLGPLSISLTAVVPFGEEFSTFEGPGGFPRPLHYAHAIWLLLGTEFSSAEKIRASRAFAKRALRSIHHDKVTVVTLRRSREQDDHDHGHGEIDWSCRWLVRGFWRHLEGYEGHRHEGQGDGRGQCEGCGKRVTWVRPYVKGPDDRPLKASRQVYRLSR
jgi:hypothetical protein